MSIRRRLDKLDADLHGGTVARQFATHVAGLSNEELQAEVDQEVRSLRHQGGVRAGKNVFWFNLV